MTELSRTHLDQLENQSIFIFREAYHAFKNIAMPWSMGKDSNVLVWLARKSFFGRVPFPILHIETTYEFPEMLEFREWAREYHKLNLIVKINTEARARGIGYQTHDPVTVTHELKTVALQQALAEYKWDALITGIRRDEDPTRAKERYFSARTAPVARRIIMSGMQCRSCAQKDFYDRRSKRSTLNIQHSTSNFACRAIAACCFRRSR